MSDMWMSQEESLKLTARVIREARTREGVDGKKISEAMLKHFKTFFKAAPIKKVDPTIMFDGGVI